MDTAKKIAFLGLGHMGAPMARHLLAQGHALTVWNRTPDKAEALAAAGATVAATPAGAVRDADLVVTMLADQAALRAVSDALLSDSAALRPGVHWIDTSTVGPDTVRALAARLPEGVTLTDAPVMGSVDRAATGKLWVLAGGDPLPGPVRELLNTLGEVTVCGPAGSGAALKLVLINAVVGGVGLVAEALRLGQVLGLPQELVRAELARGPLGRRGGPYVRRRLPLPGGLGREGRGPGHRPRPAPDPGGGARHAHRPTGPRGPGPLPHQALSGLGRDTVLEGAAPGWRGSP